MADYLKIVNFKSEDEEPFEFECIDEKSTILDVKQAIYKEKRFEYRDDFFPTLFVKSNRDSKYRTLRLANPKVKELSNITPNVLFLGVDIDQNREAVEEFDVHLLQFNLHTM